jgi:hypothetical protein
MIKIIRKDGMNTKVITVTRGAYESIYKRLGYVPFEESQEAGSRRQEAADASGKNERGGVSPPVSPRKPEKTDDELFVEEVVTKPISLWTSKELKRYALLVGIDPNAKNLKELVKAAVDSRQAVAEKESNDDSIGKNQD